jgi:hypothetical protein
MLRPRMLLFQRAGGRGAYWHILWSNMGVKMQENEVRELRSIDPMLSAGSHYCMVERFPDD